MSRVVLLDAGPLGALAHPRPQPDIQLWLKELGRSGVVVCVPEIADYEIRRELLRAGKAPSLLRLDELKSKLLYLPLTTAAMLKAAEFWAMARNLARPTAGAGDLDADVILAGQAAVLTEQGHEVTVASVNVRHLSLFTDARTWQQIR